MIKAYSIPLQITARVLAPVMIGLSLIVLYRGHHLPGGGFIGGLLGASGFGLLLLGCGVADARAALRVRPVTLLVVGLAFAMGSGLIGMVRSGLEVMAAEWLPSFYLPVLGAVHLGTPILFDIGVYLVVVGFTLMCLFALVETSNEPGQPDLP